LRKLFISLLFVNVFFCPLPLKAMDRASADVRCKEIAAKLLKNGLTEEYAYTLLERLSRIGPRLTGSAQAAAAVDHTLKEMKDLGLENIHLESVQVGHWERGDVEKAMLILSAWESLPLTVAAIGGSIATPAEGITAGVVEVRSFEELHDLGDKARGKVVFFNRPMDPSTLNTFGAYGSAVDQRIQGASEAAKAGGVAALVRSITTRLDNNPHTGMMIYESGVHEVPAACLSTIGAETLSQYLKKNPDFKIRLELNCRQLPPVISHNVIGDIAGHENPDEIIVLGGHLDSWDLGTGAHDDGAGCVQSLEALRLLKKLRLKPKRTIRAVMFMDEEFGGTGGKAYASNAKFRKGETHIAAIESDRGGFLPLGFRIGRNESDLQSFRKWESLFQSIGLYWLRPGGGGVDIGPLGTQGTLLISYIPDAQRYFDVHHSALDTLESVNPRELEMGAVAMALLAYLLSEEF
jgi:carboxypeptidase Q